jgi:hypothetical protein
VKVSITTRNFRSAFLCAAIVLGALGSAYAQQEGKSPTRMPTLPAPAGGRPPAPETPPGGVRQGPSIYDFQEHLLRWPLPAADKKYGAIDGHKLHSYVEDLAGFARKYRDDGHPQFWGRIIGTQADHDTSAWLQAKFKSFGLTDVHEQTETLVDQWMPQSWSVTASGPNGQTASLETAQPAYQTVATPAGLNLEATWVGTGSEADYVGRDVKGKAVFIESMPLPGSWRHTATAEGAIRRAETKGAAAIFAVIAIPGNVRTQLYPTGTRVPTFSMGMIDGYRMRDMIAEGGVANPAHVAIKLDVKMTPGMTTGTVWGTLPGATNEKIIIIAHRDGWFESGTDNASGVAAMVGLAEYYSKIPKAQRKRTIIFLGTTGHHNGGNVSGTWMLQHRDTLFKDAALLINLEHVATTQTYLLGEDVRFANRSTGMLWYAGGPRRPKLQDIVTKAFAEFGVTTYATPELAAPGGEMSSLWPYIAGVQASDYNIFFHSDHEGADTVPWTGLEEISRAYAKIIDGVNTLPLSDLVRPDEPPGGAPAPLASSTPAATPARAAQ